MAIAADADHLDVHVLDVLAVAAARLTTTRPGPASDPSALPGETCAAGRGGDGGAATAGIGGIGGDRGDGRGGRCGGANIAGTRGIRTAVLRSGLSAKLLSSIGSNT